MIGVAAILLEFDLAPDMLEGWIAQDFVRPEGELGDWRFHEMDVARIRLICALRETLEVNEAALPTVLSLLDQVYGMRRAMRRLDRALAALPAEMLPVLADALESDHAEPSRGW